MGVRPGLLGEESNGVEVGVEAGVGSGSRADSVLVWEGVGDGGLEERKFIEGGEGGGGEGGGLGEGERPDLGGMMLECTS